MNRVFAFVLFFCMVSSFASGQAQATRGEAALPGRILQLQALADTAISTAPRENLYIQFDKPCYAVGDTVWFKGYLLKASFLTPSAKSAILNFDIQNDSSKAVKRYRFQVRKGICQGDVALDEKDFPPGSYTIRAYSNWMRNFGDQYFFVKRLQVSSGQHLLADAAVNVAGNNISVSVRLTGMDGLPYAVRPVSAQVSDKEKTLLTQKLQTGVDGALTVSFTAPASVHQPEMTVFGDKKIPLATIPITLNRPENADVQFLPEGGYLVAGLPAHIGVKALGEDGNGIAVTGVIVDGAQKQVASFRSPQNGMGSFDLDVKQGEIYVGHVNLPGGATRDFKLPAVEHSGTVLNVTNNQPDDSIQVTVRTTADAAANHPTFLLAGMARGVLCYATAIKPQAGKPLSLRIAKSLFPTGVLHVLLTTTDYKPVNERLIFIDHRDALNVNIAGDKATYHERDSVGLKLKVTDKNGKPVRGSFSMGVTDDASVKPDTSSENILTRFLLSADLKGYVESPGYYFPAGGDDRSVALDNLLLTQGYRGYDWNLIFSPPPLNFQPETGLAVSGYVRNVFNKPVKATHVLLFSKKPAMLMDTVSDADGRFIFDRLPMIDTPIFNLKAVNKNGKSFNVDIRVDDPPPPVFASPAEPSPMPWYMTADTMLAHFVKNQALAQQQRFNPTGHLLKEVNIKDKKIIKDSQNLNGPGNADLVLDERDLAAAGKKNWLQLLQENLKDFREVHFAQGTSQQALFDLVRALYVAYSTGRQGEWDGAGGRPPDEWYGVDGKPIVLIIDGIASNQVKELKSFREMTAYLTLNSAEDIKGLEVLNSTKFTQKYIDNFDPLINGEPLLQLAAHARLLVTASDFAFVEITTRSGSGPVIDHTPGVYLYKPLPLTMPAQFYKPKYTTKDTLQHQPDLRATIDWEPNIITDANGEAMVWFYTADKTSHYTITVEGTDLMGNLAYKTGRLDVRQNEAGKTNSGSK